LTVFSGYKNYLIHFIKKPVCARKNYFFFSAL